MLIAGGECLDDAAVLRADEAHGRVVARQVNAAVGRWRVELPGEDGRLTRW
jgi:hypothetical protein